MIVSIGDRTFPRKGAARDFYKEILNRYQPGDLLTAEDELAVKTLLSHHPDVDVKVGPGLAAIKVVAADYGTQCFCVLRPDRSEERFSYKVCLDHL
jgi:hypothetical protein